MRTKAILIGAGILFVIVGLGAYFVGKASASEQQFSCPGAPAPFVLRTNETIIIKGEDKERYLACGWVGGDPLSVTPVNP